MLFAQQMLQPSAFFIFFSVRAIPASVQGVMSPPNGATVELHGCATCEKLWQNVTKTASQQLKRLYFRDCRMSWDPFCSNLKACHIDRQTFKSEQCKPL